MARENESIHGTFHLKLNLAITAELEDLETICQDELSIEHDTLDCASNLFQVTAEWVMPRKRQNIKQRLETIHKRFPTNLNVIANLISAYNSLLLMKKSSELQTKLLQLTEGDSPQDNLRKFQALAERAYVLIQDVASQEMTDDTGKLKIIIDWFEKSIKFGKPNGMTEDECLIWKFFLAKTRYRLETRYRFDDNQTEERSSNFVQMLTEFAEIYEAQAKQLPGEINKPPESAFTEDSCREGETSGDSTVVYSRERQTSGVDNVYSNLKALALAYLVDAFSIKNAADRGKKMCLWNPPKSFSPKGTLQFCHTDPLKAYEEASVLSQNYKIKTRFARAFMNWGSVHLKTALTIVLESIDSTKNTGNLKGNWFGYATCLQIYCKRYLLSLQEAKKKCTNFKTKIERFQAAKAFLRKALEYIDDCPYRSASTLLDIADIYYYLGIDPETEEKTDDDAGETNLEKSLEYLMMARERVEGYKNARTHARLAHCLWALGSWRPAIECIKLAIKMERPGCKKNFINLCKYVGEKSEDIAAKDIDEIHELGKKKYNEKEQHELVEDFAKLKICSQKENPSPSENDWQPPPSPKNNGYTYDFAILNADGDMKFAYNLLQHLENHLPTPYKGFFPERDILYGESKLLLDRTLQVTKKIIIIVTSEFLVDQYCTLIMADIICYFRDNIPTHRIPTDVNRKANIIPIILEKDCYLPYGASLLTQPLEVGTNKTLSDADFVRLMREID